jgi:hypothetical protein
VGNGVLNYELWVIGYGLSVFRERKIINKYNKSKISHI